MPDRVKEVATTSIAGGVDMSTNDSAVGLIYPNCLKESSDQPGEPMDVIELLQHHVDAFVENCPKPVILEAGCGSGGYLRFPEGSRIVGIDISQEELDKNTIVSEKIVGDIQEYEHEPNSYDLVICWDVLEHIPHPDKAFAKFCGAVKPDGLIVLAFPNVCSLKAIVAKMTPHWFHVKLYRLIYGKKYGSPGYITFPTVLHKFLKNGTIREFAQHNNLNTVVAESHESGVQKRFRRKFYLGDGVFRFFDKCLRLVTFGNVVLMDSDWVYLFRKSS